jgi:hypothetical protein
MESKAARVWCDPDTALCWQNPQKDAHTEGNAGLIVAEAMYYCDTLALDGYTDWRLPTIDELRSIVAGNAATEPDGACEVRAGTGTEVNSNHACHGGAQFGGPGTGGCYWKEGLAGTCNNPDPAAEGHPLETWASDRAIDDPEQWVAYVAFETGAAGFNHSCSVADVRCVRDDDGVIPECVTTDTCQDSGPFVNSPELTAVCDSDVCTGSDSLRVTMRVPEKLDGQPHQLMAFLYSDDNWSFPPARPPDGGTDYNQVMSPVIDVDQPLTMTIPACTYYREDRLSGRYRLYVYLQMSPGFPPTPKTGDYWWGSQGTPVEFPLSGTSHQGHSEPIDIMLEPVGTDLK